MQHIDDNWEPPVIVATEIFAEKDNGELLQFPSIASDMRARYLQSLMPTEATSSNQAVKTENPQHNTAETRASETD